MAIKETSAHIIAKMPNVVVENEPVSDPEPEAEETELTEEEKEEQERVRISKLPWWQKDFVRPDGKQHRKFYGSKLLHARAQQNLKHREESGQYNEGGRIGFADAVYEMRKDGWRLVKSRVQLLRELRAKKQEQKV